MRIVHTADWHLCNRLGRIDRTRDLQQRVETVARLCDEQRADVLIIAGDLFSEYAEAEHVTAAFDHVLRTFDPFFARGGTILAVTGNHDRDGRINLVRSGMTLAVPFAKKQGGIAGGRMYLNNGRGFATLLGPDGRAVQFVFVPYPFRSRYDLSTADYMTKEEENNLLHAKVSEWLQSITTMDGFDTRVPTVLIGHLHVRGAEVHTVYKMNAADDVQFDFADLHPSWAYVALGHIHKPQTVNGQAHVRYPGSLDRLDSTEDHEHGVILFEVGSTGLEGEPQWLPIPATPFHAVTLTDVAAELPTLAEKYPDRESAIVKVEIQPHEMTMSRDEVARQLRRVFPRLHDVKWIPREASATTTGPTIDVRASLDSTVRDYLVNHGELQADPDKDELLKLLDTFLPRGGA